MKKRFFSAVRRYLESRRQSSSPKASPKPASTRQSKDPPQPSKKTPPSLTSERQTPRHRTVAAGEEVSVQKKSVANAPPHQLVADGSKTIDGQTDIFSNTQLDQRILRSIRELGFTQWTPVQQASLPLILQGQDIAAQAQTGTGKTAAFLIAILTRLLDKHHTTIAKAKPSALILAPTRELAIQIDNDMKQLAKHCRIRHLVVYGGQDYEAQSRQLKEGVDVIAATPGRLIDFSRKKIADLSAVETLVLDEADRMLDMGFLPDIRRIINQLPAREKRQNMLFSATLNPQIMRLAEQWMNNPKKVEIAPETLVAKEVEHFAYVVSRCDKLALLMWLLKHQAGERVLIFRNRRNTAETLARHLIGYGVSCALLSGEVSQSKRLRALEAFRKGNIRVIVATDVAGRGIHVDNITHVINYDIPDEADSYIHRIGRTGRAGVAGQAISFACEDGGFMIPLIEELLGEPVRMLRPEEEMLKLPHPVRHLHSHHAVESLTGKPSSGGRGRQRSRRPGAGQRRRPPR